MEQILHYVWRHRLFDKNLKTNNGEPVEVIDVGLPNMDGGPDFFNSKVKIGGKIWVGNIEIHQSSKDWFAHKHDQDKAYNSVILHIVEFADVEVFDASQRSIPQCEIRYPQQIKENIQFLLNKEIPMACCNYLKDMDQLYVRSWINSLTIERLERKCNDVFSLADRFRNSWASVFYVLLSRSMGFGLNSDAFERLALSIPLNYILKHSDSSFQVEALLFGQAGILDSIKSDGDEYTERLKKEYLFLKNKYSLSPLDKHIFKTLRVRPTGSPHIRIAQLATLLTNIQGLYSKVLNSKSVGQIRLLLHMNASEYWQTHYSLGEKSPFKRKYIGDSSLDILIINAVVPIVFAAGKYKDDQSYIDRAMSFLEGLKPESNSIIKLFGQYGIRSESAYDSQALIQLKREYCEKKKCLFCRIGYNILSQN